MGSDEILTVGTEYPVGAPKVQLRSRANGQTLDSWTGGGGIEGTAWSCVIDPSGAFIIGGHLNPGGYEWFITKFNHDLEVVWTQGAGAEALQSCTRWRSMTMATSTGSSTARHPIRWSSSHPERGRFFELADE